MRFYLANFLQKIERGAIFDVERHGIKDYRDFVITNFASEDVKILIFTAIFKYNLPNKLVLKVREMWLCRAVSERKNPLDERPL